MIKWILVFTATVTADWLWAKWAIACRDHRAALSSVYSAGIVACGAFTVVEYTIDHWLIIPAAAGGALGTFIAVRKS